MCLLKMEDGCLAEECRAKLRIIFLMFPLYDTVSNEFRELPQRAYSASLPTVQEKNMGVGGATLGASSLVKHKA